MTSRYPLLALIVVFVSFGLASCGHGGKKQDVQSLLASARNYESSGQYRAAMIEIRNAIQANPADPRGHIALARTLIALGQARQAIQVLERVPDQSPEHTLTLARAYVNAGKARSAYDLLEKEAGVLQKGHGAELAELLAEVALQRDELDTAMHQYEAVLEQDKTSVAARIGLARVDAAKGDMDKAETELDGVLKTNPTDPKALLYASALHTNRDDLPGAEELLMRAVAAAPATDLITPLRYSILAALTDNLTKQGKTSEALAYSQLLSNSMQDLSEINRKMQQAVEAIASSDFERARKLLTEVQAQAPNLASAGRMLGVVDYLQGDNDAAVKQFQQFVDPEVASPEALRMFVMAELKLNQPGEVIARLKKDIDGKKDGRVVALYGIALVSAGQTGEGEAYLRKAIDLKPDDPRLRLPLVRLLDSAGKQEAALEQLRLAFKSGPADPLVQAGLVEQLVSMNRQAEAAKTVEDLRKKYPNSTETQVLAANFYLRQKPGEARQILEQLPSLDQSARGLHLVSPDHQDQS